MGLPELYVIRFTVVGCRLLNGGNVMQFSSTKKTSFLHFRNGFIQDNSYAFTHPIQQGENLKAHKF